MATLDRRRIPEPGYLHPIELKKKHQLTDARLAILLGKKIRSIEKYTAPSTEPDELPESVLIQSWLVDYYLSHESAKIF